MNGFSHHVHERLLAAGAKPGDRLLLGLSGGQDSTALLLALRDGWGLPGRIAAAHLDHGIREGSGEEAGKVAQLCSSLGVPLLTGRLDPREVRTLARQRGSLEAALRELRYTFLRSSSEAFGAKWVLTGHTLDDQVETVLFRVLRGMNPMSFSGIPETRPPYLRPLLGFQRAQTLSFCLESGVEPLVDPSNLEVRFARNRIRSVTVPFLKNTFHRDLEGLVLRMGSAAGGLAAAVGGILRSGFPEVFDALTGDLSADGLRSMPIPLREALIADFLRERTGRWPSASLLREVTRRLSRARPGGPMSLPGGLVLFTAEGKVSIREPKRREENDVPVVPVPLPVPGTVRFEASGITLTSAVFALGADMCFPAGDTALLRKNGLQPPLRVRRRQAGDRFTPLGSSRSKKLKEFFIDRKVPRLERDRIPLVLDSRGEILWVAGVELSGKAALQGYEGEEAVLIRISRKK